MKFIAVDLEMEQPSKEIISVGISHDGVRKNFLITPSQPISEYIQNLTGLKDEMYDWNKSRQTCFMEVYYYIGTLITNGYHTELVTWGPGDTFTLRKQMGDHQVYGTFNGCINVKTIFNLYMMQFHGRDINVKTSLSSALKTLKIQLHPDSIAHDSSWDAYNTMLLFDAIQQKYQDITDVIKRIKQM